MNSADTSRDTAVRVRNLRRTFEPGPVVALDDLSLDVAAGEFVAICGPSGCGKSTLLNMITCIDRPDGGTIDVFGRSLTRMNGAEADAYRANDVGLVFQLHNLLPHLTAIENVQVPMLGIASDRAERVRRAEELLDRVGMSHRLHSLPTTLSGGERQRVAVARAMANKPRLILADEPTGALDSITGERLLGLLVDLRDTMQVTLIVVTHEQGVAMMADRTIRMLDGRIDG
ncbi:MAG: ABC transporter ATP-binding protein [Phycisphaerales bacterium]|nr:ABC transporter ATP-binding protein [Phycisphaerales bacterium]MCB9856584.1 ABC transporter ATP-binding protein [Phycisphaerales bacterium]MCB9864619.1 ABC transporter ATP-binding protein [Phycisphaerales bacterium]